jgi:catechol 2,3-dioxygenase-like lactoylglutathione lyase family enzyme
MAHPNFFILIVDSPAKSAEFYTKLLGNPPVEAAPTFAMFALPSGVMLGLWSKHTISPSTQVTGGGTEVAFALDNKAEVEKTYAQWQALGIPFLQAPLQAEFGFNFLASDPDGHRIRVFTPNAG